jgi:hypothetical protein
MRHHVIRPWLPRSHPNFFLIYTGTLVFHLWCAVNGFFGPDRWWDFPVYRYTNLALHPYGWAIWNLVVAMVMFAGLHLRTFTWSRVALGVGSAWVWARVILFAAAWQTENADVGTAVPVYLLTGILHISQILEPPVNPQSAKVKL